MLHLISGLDTLTDSETNKQTGRWTDMQGDEFLQTHTDTQLDCDWAGMPKVVGSFTAWNHHCMLGERAGAQDASIHWWHICLAPQK